jgi:hypothetical protein
MACSSEEVIASLAELLWHMRRGRYSTNWSFAAELFMATDIYTSLLSGTYKPGDYHGWLAWRRGLPDVARV